MGQSPPGSSYNSDGIGLPFMQGSAEFGEHNPTPVKWCSLPAKIAEVGDLLISVRAPVGDTNIANQRIAIGRGLATIRGGKESITEFLRLLVQKNTAELIANSGTGMFSSITGKNLKEFKVLMPPLGEQKRIVDVVSSVDAYIDALQQQVESARVARSAVLHNLLTAGGEDWTETTIGEMAQWQGGITPSMANDGYWKDGMIPWISSGDVLQLNTRGAQKHVTDAALEETSVKLLPVNTVLVVVRSGILVHTLPVAILETPSTINQDIKAGVPHSAVLGQFLFWVLRSNSQTILETCRKTGTTVQSISTEAFLKFPVLLPPLVEQKRIVEIVSSMDEAIQSTEKAVLDAKVLRTALLSDLLSGNHEIPASYDSLLGAA